MKRNLIRNKSAISMAIVAIVIVIIIIAAVAGAYYYTQKPSTSPSPSPSATSTPSTSPSATTSPSSTESPTASPSASASPTTSPSTNPVVNFKAGAYANYNTTTYIAGVAESTGLNFTIGEETYSGTPCWALTTAAGNDTSNVAIVERINKGNTSELLGNVTMKVYQDGALTYEQDFDPTTTSTSGAGTEEINPNSIIGQETITVPAGTFDCMKATQTTTTTTTDDTVTTIWMSANVPAFGMVRADSTVNGVLSSTLVLISYGGWP